MGTMQAFLHGLLPRHSNVVQRQGSKPSWIPGKYLLPLSPKYPSISPQRTVQATTTTSSPFQGHAWDLSTHPAQHTRGQNAQLAGKHLPQARSTAGSATHPARGCPHLPRQVPRRAHISHGISFCCHRDPLSFSVPPPPAPTAHLLPSHSSDPPPRWGPIRSTNWQKQ